MRYFLTTVVLMLFGLILNSGCRQSDVVSVPSLATSTAGYAATQLISTSLPSPASRNELTQWAQTNTEVPQDTEITLKRTACYGTCPIYSIRISADGQIQFDGQDYVSHKGKSSGQTTAAHVRQLLQQFASINFFELRDQYGAMGDCPVYATDHPSVLITLHFASKTKTVELYLGCISSGEAQALAQLSEQIDKTVNSQQWIE